MHFRNKVLMRNSSNVTQSRIEISTTRPNNIVFGFQNCVGLFQHGARTNVPTGKLQVKKATHTLGNFTVESKMNKYSHDLYSCAGDNLRHQIDVRTSLQSFISTRSAGAQLKVAHVLVLLPLQNCIVTRGQMQCSKEVA